MPSTSITYGDALLAFRRAKKTVTSERAFVSLTDYARFERQLDDRIQALIARYQQSWFDKLNIGHVVIVPKSAKARDLASPDIVRVDRHRKSKLDLTVRIQLEPSPEFATAEILYLHEFGPALESLLGSSCVGYRLKRVRAEGEMDRYDRDIYEYWPKAFERYRDDPISAARAHLRRGDRVVITSTDVVAFFDYVDPGFLIDDDFVEQLHQSATRVGRAFSRDRYRIATSSLLRQFKRFRRQRSRVAQTTVDATAGVPIGALTSRLFANIALHSLDNHIESVPDVVLYRRYVDDIVVVQKRNPRDPSPDTRLSVLRSLFPEFYHIEGQSRFVVPSTRAVFELNDNKTLVHDLIGQPGLDFLAAVQESFSVVVSERRAFFSDVEQLATEIDGVDLFGDRAGDRIPRLRDADRFTLRRFMASAFVRGLERAAVLLGDKDASAFVEKKTRRLLSVIDGDLEFDNIDIVISLIMVAHLCDCSEVVKILEDWHNSHLASLDSRVETISWRGFKLSKARAVDRLRVYLEQRSVRNGRDFDHLAEGDRQSGRIMIGWPARAAAVAVRHRGELHVDTSMVAQCDGQWT